MDAWSNADAPENEMGSFGSLSHCSPGATITCLRGHDADGRSSLQVCFSHVAHRTHAHLQKLALCPTPATTLQS